MSIGADRGGKGCFGYCVLILWKDWVWVGDVGWF